jgi:hypothetical protein
MSISAELEQLVEGVSAAVADRWPGVRFHVWVLNDALAEDLFVHWVRGDTTPTVDDVREVVHAVAARLNVGELEYLASVDVFGWAPLLAEAVTVVRAWRGGDLVKVPQDHYLYGQVSDGVTYNPDTLDLAGVPAMERQLAEAVCAHAGITVDEHWQMLGRDAVFELRQILGDTVLEVGDSLVIAMGTSPGE